MNRKKDLVMLCEVYSSGLLGEGGSDMKGENLIQILAHSAHSGSAERAGSALREPAGL